VGGGRDGGVGGGGRGSTVKWDDKNGREKGGAK
jgi:hypothetical protein